MYMCDVHGLKEYLRYKKKMVEIPLQVFFQFLDSKVFIEKAYVWRYLPVPAQRRSTYQPPEAIHVDSSVQYSTNLPMVMCHQTKGVNKIDET